MHLVCLQGYEVCHACQDVLDRYGGDKERHDSSDYYGARFAQYSVEAVYESKDDPGNCYNDYNGRDSYWGTVCLDTKYSGGYSSRPD